MHPPAHFSAPATVSAPFGTDRVKSCPSPADEAFSVTAPVALSVMITAPVVLAVRSVAVVSVTVIPPVPLASVKDGVSNNAVEIAPALPGDAVSEIEVVAANAPANVMLPPVEVRLRIGADKLVRPASLSVSKEETVTLPVAPVPVMVPPRVTPLVVDVSPIEFAASVPLVDKAVLAVRSIDPMLPLLARMFPVVLIEPFVAVTLNVAPLPADELFKVTAPAVVAVTLTLPVELADRAVAEVAPMVIPPLPDVVFKVDVVIVPAVTEPAPPGVADKVRDDATVTGPVRMTSPPVEESPMLGAAKLVRAESVSVLKAVKFIAPVAPTPVTVAPAVTSAVVDVRLTVLPVMVAPVVSAFSAVRLTVPIVPIPAAIAPEI